MRERRMFDARPGGERRGGYGRGWEEGRGPASNEEFGSGRRGKGRGGRRDGERQGGRRDRARRGDARYIILDALRDGPKHGYEIIKVLEERSGGRYVPSPGTVYPTLQYLEDQGFVRAKEEAERRVYQLTETGQAELETQARPVSAFWQRFGGEGLPPATQHELDFLHEELEHLNRTVRGALRSTLAGSRPDTIRRVRNAIEECRNKVREIITSEPAE